MVVVRCAFHGSPGTGQDVCRDRRPALSGLYGSRVVADVGEFVRPCGAPLFPRQPLLHAEGEEWLHKPAERSQDSADRPGNPRRADRQTAASRKGTASNDVGDRQGVSAQPRSRGDWNPERPYPADGRPPAGRGVRLRAAVNRRPRVHLQARSHAAGHVPIGADGAAQDIA